MRHRIALLILLLSWLLCYEGRGLPVQGDKPIDWKFIFTTKRIKHYYDPASVSQNNGIGRMRVKQEYEPTDSRDWDNFVRGVTENRRNAGHDVTGYDLFDHTVSVFEFDCSDMNLRMPELIDYDSKGRVLSKMEFKDTSWLVSTGPEGSEYLMPLFSIACGIKPDQINKCAKPADCLGEDCKTNKANGLAYTVPKLRVQLLDKDTGKPVAMQKVAIGYIWEWLQEPKLVDSVLGWTSESYTTSCMTNKDGMVEADEFTVVPRGSYKSNTAKEQPRFKQLDVSYEINTENVFHSCYQSNFIYKAELEKCKAAGNCTFVFKVSCK
jgi:hypothetical protein